MDLTRIDTIAREEMGDRKAHPAREPSWLYHHGVRTARIAGELADHCTADVDREALFAGALFHDLGKGESAHHKAGARRVRELLADLCEPDRLDAIGDMVRCHNQRSAEEPFSLSIRLVQDADILDHVGPIGSWLAFYWSGTHNESAQDNLAFIRGEENRLYRATMRRELNFDVSVRFFDERIAWEDRFFETFDQVYHHGVWHRSED